MSIAFRMDDVRPGCSDDGFAYPVTLIVHATVTNHSGRPLILSRELSESSYYRVAASPERGALGEYEVEFGALELASGDTPQPTFGREPDRARFVVIAPGSSYETDVGVRILATDKQRLKDLAPDKTVGFVLPGPHAIQTTIRTWPHIFVDSGTVERLRHQWKRHGDLVTADVQTAFLQFELPDAMVRCDEP